MERWVQYFELWKDWSKDQSKNTDEWNVKKRDQLFIAGLTLKNLKICLSGFLYYAKEVLSTSSAISFIPYLHANQSSLESIFSVIRSCKRDNAQLFERGMVGCNFRFHTKMATRAANKAYSGDQIVEENADVYSDEFDLTAGPKRREIQWKV